VVGLLLAVAAAGVVPATGVSAAAGVVAALELEVADTVRSKRSKCIRAGFLLLRAVKDELLLLANLLALSSARSCRRDSL
jgi:hypothetical protein